jgi:hypothetical protein
VTIQFFLNMEIERWTLATGESAVVGFVRLSRVFVPVFLVCGTVPWIWPGWATGAATILSWEFGLPITGTAVVGLVGCGLILSVGPVVYRTVEFIQLALVAVTFCLLLGLAVALVRAETLAAFAAGAVRFGHIPEGVHLPMLLGALAFAGAGGSVNLAQSNYIKDKGYGMGRWIGRITSPFTGREEGTSEVGVAFDDHELNRARWQLWWRRTNWEHFLSFYLLCLLSLALFCLIAGTLLEPGGVVAEGFGFIRDEAGAIEGRFGPLGRGVFLAVGVAVLFSTELALLDAVARVAADLLKVGLFLSSAVSVSHLYFAVVWGMIAIGVLVLGLGFDRPLVLIVLSASLNGFVMFLYSGLLLWMNLRTFHGPLRPHPVRGLALLGSFLFFGYLSARIFVDGFSELG